MTYNTLMDQNTYFDTAADRVAAAETPDAMGAEITDFLCQVLNTVLMDGAVNVTDLAGRIASNSNNYLLSEDGGQFNGLVTVATGEVTEFTIFEKPNGSWGVELPCALVA